MEYTPSQLALLLKRTKSAIRSNVWLLSKFLLVLLILVSVYSSLFHLIMKYEGREFSIVSSIYWTIVTMSTLGFGDITFTSDLGKAFSIIVLLSGIVFLLVMLPFIFIQFFYAPWLEIQTKARAPRYLPATAKGHVVLTNSDPISLSLVEKLIQYNYDYVIVVQDPQRAIELREMGYKVILGDLGEPETYRRLRIDKAALVVANNNDTVNTDTVFTIRSVSKDVPIVATADSDDSVDILQLAGASYVFQFAKMLGSALARRAIGSNVKANVLGRFGELLIAEAPAMHTPLEGKTLMEIGLTDKTGAAVVGMWERGNFKIPLPESRINAATVLVLAGSEDHFNKYDEIIGSSYNFSAPVVIFGYGRVGKAISEALKERGIDYRIVEKEIIGESEKYIHGNAADLATLAKAGIKETPCVFITSHDDDINIYLTIYCRKLRPDIQIISRVTLDRDIKKLYEAGADVVMSYASVAVNTIINVLKPDRVLTLTEGLDVFRVTVPSSFIGKSLIETGITQKTGCSVVAMYAHGAMSINPNPYVILEEGTDLILIGTTEAEKKFYHEFPLSR